MNVTLLEELALLPHFLIRHERRNNNGRQEDCATKTRNNGE